MATVVDRDGSGRDGVLPPSGKGAEEGSALATIGADASLPVAAIAAQALAAGPYTPLVLAALLDLRDVCRLSLLCRATGQGFGRRSRKACLTKGAGVPEDRRLEYWRCVLNVDKEIAERTAAAQNRGASAHVYEACLYEDAGAVEAAAALAGPSTWPSRGISSCDGGVEGVLRSRLPASGLRALSSDGAEGEISRDVGRTFPNQPLFRSRHGPGQNMLANILKAFLKTNPDVGYCQGMNFVAGALLLACAQRDPEVAERSHDGSHVVGSGAAEPSVGVGVVNAAAGAIGAVGAESAEGGVSYVARVASMSSWESDDVDASGYDDRQSSWRSSAAHLRAERDVFWLMMALTSRLTCVGSGLGMRELWLPGVPQLKVRVFQFDKLLREELPRLYNHFKAKQLQLEVLVSQWFLTLFAYSLRPPMLLRVLDLTFTDGWKAMFRFGIARLKSVEATLCELELEGVSRFLRGFRDSDSPVPSPTRGSAGGHEQDRDREGVSAWYQRRVRGRMDASGGGTRKASKDMTRCASSMTVLRVTGEVKVTRRTLGRLQKDFAVQLLKEHLQGEGQWLRRYGNAPEPTPGSGAGVVGGAADGDMGFMGVEAMTRMMLSDAKLLGKLKEELASMTAPLDRDARVFRTKITEASERHEEATREKTALAAELMALREDIEALGERKKLVAEQMHLLLVQYEEHSAERALRHPAGASGSTGSSIHSSSNSSSSSEDGGGRRVRVSSPSSSSSDVGDELYAESEMEAETASGTAVGRSTFGSGGGSGGAREAGGLHRGHKPRGATAAASSSGSGSGSHSHGVGPQPEPRASAEVDDGKGVTEAKGYGDGAAAAAELVPKGDVMVGDADVVVESFFDAPGHVAVIDGTTDYSRSAHSLRGADSFSRKDWKPQEASAQRDSGTAESSPRLIDAKDDVRRGQRPVAPRPLPGVSVISSRAVSYLGADVPDARRKTGEGTAWGRLTKWVGTARPVTTNWFTTRGLGSGPGEGGDESSPPRPRQRSRRRDKRRQLTLMEELYEDLAELRRRLVHLQTGIDDKTEMYATLFNSYTRAMVEAEEAQELKRALSAQMIQLLFEQEQRLEGYLRECITFDGDGGAGLLRGGSSSGSGEDNHGVAPSDKSVRRVSSGVSGDDRMGDYGGINSPPPPPPPHPSQGVETFAERRPAGDTPLLSPRAREAEDYGFEKVESWMASEVEVPLDVGRRDEAGDGVGLPGDRRRGREGSLLVPFPIRHDL